MRFLSLGLGAAMAFASVSFASAGTTVVSISLEDLLSRHLAARGGAAAMAAIRSLEMTGSMRPGGFDVPFTYREVAARPGSVRIEATLQGLTVVQAWDGDSGWQIQPFQGRKDAESLSEDDVKSLAEEADFEAPLINAAAKGVKLERLDDEDIDGLPAYAVRATLKNGDQQTYYLDPEAMLTLRVITRQSLRGAETFSQTDYGDYEKVAGVYFPFEVASGPKGSSVQQKVTYSKIVANIVVDPKIFTRPSAAVAAK